MDRITNETICAYTFNSSKQWISPFSLFKNMIELNNILLGLQQTCSVAKWDKKTCKITSDDRNIRQMWDKNNNRKLDEIQIRHGKKGERRLRPGLAARPPGLPCLLFFTTLPLNPLLQCTVKISMYILIIWDWLHKSSLYLFSTHSNIQCQMSSVSHQTMSQSPSVKLKIF